MAYHVGTSSETNIIYAGTVNKRGDKWVNKSVVTDECLVAVRDHFIHIMQKEETKEVGYRWTLSDGNAIELTVKVLENPEELKESKDGK